MYTIKTFHQFFRIETSEMLLTLDPLDKSVYIGINYWVPVGNSQPLRPQWLLELLDPLCWLRRNTLQ